MASESWEERYAGTQVGICDVTFMVMSRTMRKLNGEKGRTPSRHLPSSRIVESLVDWEHKIELSLVHF